MLNPSTTPLTLYLLITFSRLSKMDLSTSSIEDKKLATNIRFKFKPEGENIEAGNVVFEMKVKHDEETKEEVEEEKSGSIDGGKQCV